MEVIGKKRVGWVLFSLLVVIAAFVGATAGLLIVYSTDLPQVEGLERYRPGAITELYDDQGRIIGTFALQRRVIAAFDDYPPVLRDALSPSRTRISTATGESIRGGLLGAAFRDIESGGNVQGGSTLTMQLARNLFLSPDRSFHRKDSGGVAGHPDRAPLHQAADLHALCEPDFSRDMASTVLKRPRNTTSANPPRMLTLD